MSSARSVAGLAVETVEQPGRLDVEIFGHRLKVYRAIRAIFGPMTAPLLHGLPPIVGEGAHTLILGNMLSVMSVASQQYYGNPRNAFWRITGELFGFAADDPYDDRTAALDRQRHRGVGRAEIMQARGQSGLCGRAGQHGAQRLWRAVRYAQPGITRVLFNGAAAEKNFNRLVRVAPDVHYRRLPSTSPAQTMRYEDKLAAWREAITAS